MESFGAAFEEHKEVWMDRLGVGVSCYCLLFGRIPGELASSMTWEKLQGLKHPMSPKTKASVGCLHLLEAQKLKSNEAIITHQRLSMLHMSCIPTFTFENHSKASVHDTMRNFIDLWGLYTDDSTRPSNAAVQPVLVNLVLQLTRDHSASISALLDRT